MTKKIQYIVFGGIAVLIFLWLTRLSGLLLLGVLCIAAPFIQKRFDIHSIEDFEARITAIPRLVRVALATLIGAFIGNFIGRVFLMHTSLGVILTAAAFGYAAWYLTTPKKPPMD